MGLNSGKATFYILLLLAVAFNFAAGQAYGNSMPPPWSATLYAKNLTSTATLIMDLVDAQFQIPANATPVAYNYNITFSETGLPYNTTWSASLNNMSSQQPAPEPAMFNVVNGTFSYVIPKTVSSGITYVAMPSHGNVVVTRSASYIINFSIQGYNTTTSSTASTSVTTLGTTSTTIPSAAATTSINAVNTTFEETGLPGGAQWSVALADINITGIVPNAIIFTTSANYMYAFYVPNVTLPNTVYAPGPATGTILSGNIMHIYFTANVPAPQTTTTSTTVATTTVPTTSATSTTTVSTTLATTIPPANAPSLNNVTFYEIGLPQNATWQVTLGSLSSQQTAPGSAIFLIRNGTYDFNIKRPYYSNTVWVPDPASGNVMISGSGSYTVSFMRNSTSNTATIATTTTTTTSVSTTTSTIAYFTTSEIGGIERAAFPVSDISSAMLSVRASVVRQVSFNMAPGASSINISIYNASAALMSLPSPPSPVYQYFQINGTAYNSSSRTYSAADNYVYGVSYGFSVPSQWLDGKVNAPSSVRLFKYVGGAWTALPTFLTGFNGTSYIYTAQSNSFSSYAVGFTASNAAVATNNDLLILPANYKTWFYASGYNTNGDQASGCTSLAANYINDTNSSACTSTGSPSARYTDAASIGHNSLVNGNEGSFTLGTGGLSYSGSIAGIGANVIFRNGAVYQSNNPAGTTLNLNFNTGPSNSFVVLGFASGGQPFSGVTLPSGAGCTVQSRASGTASDAEIATCMAPSNTYTASLTTAAASGLAIAAYVFGAYNAIFDSSPAAANIVSNGVSLSNGISQMIIGTGTINAIAPLAPANTEYDFGGWQVSNSINLSVSNSGAPNTFLTVEGNGIVTANWIFIPQFYASVSNTLIDTNQYQVVNALAQNEIDVITYNYLVYNSMGLVTNMLTVVQSPSNTFTFKQNPAWGTGQFMVNAIISDQDCPTCAIDTHTYNGVIYGVNTPVSSTSFTASNSIIDADLRQTLTATLSGGTSPYSYNYLIYNSIGLVTSAQFSNIAPGANSFAFTQNPAWGTGQFRANVIITDGATVGNVVTNTLTYAANTPFLSTLLTASDAIANFGQLQTISTALSGGTPMYTINILVYNSIGIVDNSLLRNTPLTSNTFTFVQNPAWGTGQFTVNAIYTDAAVPPTTIYNSITYNTAECQVVLSTNSINFGTVVPTGASATSNLITVSGSIGYTANILTAGSNWISGVQNFFVSNTLWNPTSAPAGVGNGLSLWNGLTSSLLDSSITVPSLASNSLYFGMSVPPGQAAGTYTQNIVLRNSCGPIQSATTNVMANVIVPSACFISLNNIRINFGNLEPGGTAATGNIVIDTNANGNTNANLLVSGTNWISGSNMFYVANTLWNPTSAGIGIGNSLSLYGGSVQTDTRIVIPPGSANSIYFGLSIPPSGVAKGAWSQNIILDNSC